MFKKFFKKKKEEPKKTKTELIQNYKNMMMLKISKKLESKGCTYDEIQYVMSIIENAEKQIQMVKDGLIGTNINPQGDPGKPLYDGIQEIRRLQDEMTREVSQAIQEILKNKN